MSFWSFEDVVQWVSKPLNFVSALRIFLRIHNDLCCYTHSYESFMDHCVLQGVLIHLCNSMKSHGSKFYIMPPITCMCITGFGN